MTAASKALRDDNARRAAISVHDRSILVEAGAGSGKTATMAQRMVWHIVNGNVRPDEVLGLTFTTKAAGELAERVESQLRHAEHMGLLPHGQLNEVERICRESNYRKYRPRTVRSRY